MDLALPGVVFHMRADFNAHTDSVYRKGKAAATFAKIRLGPFRKPVPQAVAGKCNLTKACRNRDTFL